jgi:membrane-bound serine protease (ClpP class)
VLSGVFFLGIIGMAIKARQRPVVSGREQLVGSLGTVLEDFTGQGRIHVHGENWTASSAVALKRGQTVRVTGAEGLILQVEPIQES